MSRVQVHTVDQPNSDITAFVLSCNRLDLLDRTFQSFLSTRDQDTKIVIVDDSAVPGIFDELVKKYGHISDIICFPTNRMQWWAMDFMVSYCDTKYIFYLEDDWELLKTGYLTLSKNILEKYRDIGTVDISQRTFEWQGIESYDRTLIDNTFYYKKFWSISDYHYKWYGWIGSPNLKRREDLILLGRIEKYYQEIWIDRKFYALGFKSIFINDKFCEHLGDNRSRAAPFRKDEHLTPEDKYPKELLPNRVYPVLNYRQWDNHLKSPEDITLITALIDIDRTDRDFGHYINGLSKILETRHPIVIYCEEKYFSQIKQLRTKGNLSLQLITKEDLEFLPGFDKIQNIISSDDWKNQSPWMKDSVINSKYYITLTLMKSYLMRKSLDKFSSTYYYWIDSGIYNSFHIDRSINDFYFSRIPRDKFFLTAFPYHTDYEIHGMNVHGMTEIAGIKPNFVCRASLMGGTRENIILIDDLFYDQLKECLSKGIIGTEEAIYTLLALKHPEKFHVHHMSNGDIFSNYFMKLI